jgi:hypothetical protein
MTVNFFRKAATALALTAAVALPAAAQAGEAKSFNRAGVTYTYTSEQKGEATVLTGSADGTPFRLVVKGKYITGEFANQSVSFTTADVIATRTLAMR